jgi:hypothetical protein
MRSIDKKMKCSQPDKALVDLIGSLSKYIVSPSPNLPKSSISIVSLAKRPAGIGNRLGVADLGSFSALEIKGCRFDAVVRFYLWGDDPEDVDIEMAKLQGRILGAVDCLKADGFLSIILMDSSSSEQVASMASWRKYADFKVLYEFTYPDVDGAVSLISQIPISVDGHTTVVSHNMVRWDNQSASPLQFHSLSRRLPHIRSVSMIAFLPSEWNGLEVTVSATIQGSKHECNFANLRDFCNAFNLERDNRNLKTTVLGENGYLIGRLDFPNSYFPFPLIFQGNDDCFCISYAASSLDSSAVVYFRLLGLG